MHSGRLKLPLQYDVSFSKALLDVSPCQLEMSRNVSGLISQLPQRHCPQAVQENGGGLLHRLVDIRYRAQFLILDPDSFDGFLGRVGIAGGNGRDGMALVQHFVAGKYVVAQICQISQAVAYAEGQQRAGIIAVHPGGTADVQRLIMARRIGVGRQSKEEAYETV